jgi:integrase
MTTMARKSTRVAQGYSVFQRKDKRWGWAVTIGYDPVTGNPQRRSGTCKTQKEAIDLAVSASVKAKQGELQPSGRDTLLSAFLADWLETYVRPHRQPMTTSYYERMIRLHIVPKLGHVKLRKLTPMMVQTLINEKSKPMTDGTKLSTETVRGIIATLRSALTQAFKNGLVAENVVKRVTMPKQDRKDPEYLQPAEVARLLEAAKNHPLHGMFALTVLTGLRFGEVSGLTWDDIDFETRTIKVEKQLQRIAGTLQLKSLKTTRSKRKLHMSETARTILEGIKVDQAIKLAPGQNPMRLVFLNSVGNPLDAKYVDVRLKELMARAGLKPMSFHKLRHTAATLLLASGSPLTVVRDQLGHSQITLTANSYGHAVPTALRDAAEQLESLFKKADNRH